MPSHSRRVRNRIVNRRLRENTVKLYCPAGNTCYGERAAWRLQLGVTLAQNEIMSVRIPGDRIFLRRDCGSRCLPMGAKYCPRGGVADRCAP